MLLLIIIYVNVTYFKFNFALTNGIGRPPPLIQITDAIVRREALKVFKSTICWTQHWIFETRLHNII